MIETTATPTARSRLLLWLPLILGIVLGLMLVEYARETVLFRVENAAFGRDTQRFAPVGTRNQCADAEDNAQCISAWRKAAPAAVAVAIWFGNSQLEGINRFKPGDVNAPELLHRALTARGTYLVTYSQPNANLTEEAIIWNAIAPIYRPKLLILPVCYDDIRELGVRDTVGDMLDDPATLARLKAQPYWSIISSAVDEGMKANAPKLDPHPSLQTRSETAINDLLSSISPLWSDRSQLRSIMAFAIHGMRNEALGIHSTSKRPVDPAVLANRMALLDAMLAEAHADGTQVLLYAPPYRQDIDGPYPMKDYRAFKAQMAALAAKHGATFLDIDPIVPGPEWATVTDDIFGFQEPDFMHFTADGHKRLTAGIDGALRRMGY